MQAHRLTPGGSPAPAAAPETGAGRGTVVDRAEALAATLPPLLVAADRVAATVAQGVHGRRRVGPGESFWQFRRYQPGDPTLRIDWRKSARSQRVFIKQTEWDAAQSVWLWRDGSPSMDWRSTDRWTTKQERAELLLLALASLLTRGGEHLALLGTGRPPGAGRAVLRRIAETLAAGRAPTDSLPGVDALPRYGRLVLFGDFLSPLEDVQAMIAGYARLGVRGHIVQILDPAEETLPYAGRVRFEGLEHEGEALIGRVEAIRARYRAVLDGHRAGLAALARSAGWNFTLHHLDQPPQPTLLALFVVLSEGG